jgi:hypothetical protein
MRITVMLFEMWGLETPNRAAELAPQPAGAG